ncbi:zwei Ig domain protein zig-8-like [Oratosquilla oratoria]|uniref:zwei Ig domain protein zig-8-like n=1 Tax=Oratosquilla oratoria TaxID=337810 RepID=UPI003F777191
MIGQVVVATQAQQKVMDFLIFLLFAFLIHTVEGFQTVTKGPPLPRPGPMWDNPLLRPNFDRSNVRHVIASAGHTAFLRCKINHLGDRAVTWIRKSDVQILTANTFIYTTDPRFSAFCSSTGDEWVLKITGAVLEDSGGYECQVSTNPKISMNFQLQVVVAYAEIKGKHEVYINSGGKIDLTCSVSRITDPPEFIIWYHENQVINYSERGGIQVITDQSTKSSNLLIRNAQREDSGNYTCVPSNAVPASVSVHILREEIPAAMQHGLGVGAPLPSSPSLILMVLSLVITLYSLTIPGSGETLLLASASTYATSFKTLQQKSVK